MTTGIFPLRGKVRHYAWGGSRFLPELLGRPADGLPWAEYWLGAHPGDPAEVLVDDQWQRLDQLIAQDPRAWLGASVAKRFGQLPYLMKILDVAQPLSIQVHPNLAQAKAGFEREDAQGIALDAPARNFKDRNHKPELALALSDFWLLYGFRPEHELARDLARFSSLCELAQLLRRTDLKTLFAQIMQASDRQLSDWLVPVFSSLVKDPPQEHPDYWIDRWRQPHSDDTEAVDRGVFGFFLMNLVCLRPGQSLFQDANVPHSYLQGQCVEIMANSDNVLRAGLTPKHVDPVQLAAHLSFSTARRQSAPPPDLQDFSLRHLRLEADEALDLAPGNMKILLVLEGRLAGANLQLKTGQAAVLPHSGGASLTASAHSTIAIAAAGASDPTQGSEPVCLFGAG